MKGSGATERRLLDARARGISRTQIIGPIARLRPPLVLIVAPSGYGKTVLAAQIAQACREVLWVAVGGHEDNRRAPLRRILEALASLRENPQRNHDNNALMNQVVELMSALTESDLAVVVDGAPELDAACIDALGRLAERLPEGGMLIVTARATQAVPVSPSVWRVGPSDLTLNEAELAELWTSHSGERPDAAQVADLFRHCGGQAALAALVARHWRSSDLGGLLDAGDVHRLIRSLVESQLNEAEARALRCAAVLTDGTVQALGACLDISDAAGLLIRAGEVIPLLRVDASRASAAFSVHQLVSDALCDTPNLSQSDADWLERSVEELARRGNRLRALGLAARIGNESVILKCLESAGEELVSEGHEAQVRDSIDLLSPSALVGSPEVLLLKAGSQWERNDVADAIRLAGVALSLAEHEGDVATTTRARLLLARVRTSIGDYAEAAAEADSLLGHVASTRDPSVIASAVSSAILASGFSADRERLNRALRIAADDLELGMLDGQAGSRLAVCRGVVAGFLDGDWRQAARQFRRGCQYHAGPVHGAVCHGNLGGACLEIGDIEASLSALDRAQELAGAAGFEMVVCSTALTRQVAASVSRSGVDLEPLVMNVLAASERAGDRVTALCALLYATGSALMRRRSAEASRYAEQAQQLASESGSPVLRWHSAMALAETAAVSGDVQWAAQSAADVLASASAHGASGLELRARLLVGRSLVLDGRLRDALETVAHSREYCERTWPNLALASHVRAFPEVLGLVVVALGPSVTRAPLLRLIDLPNAREALEAAVDQLPREDLDALSVRMLGHPFDPQVHSVGAPAERPEPPCTVRLFGGFEVRTPAGPVADKAWVKRKSRLLFAMLATRPGKDVPREQIIDYLWPEMDEQRGLNNFYVAWSSMKRALSPEAGRDEGCPYVEHVRGVCRLTTEAVRCDLVDFEESLSIARKARGAGDIDSELAALHAVADLYRGELLPGDSYDDWFAPLRERCRHDFEDAMLRSAEILESRGELQAALGLLRRALAHDPWREDLYQSALRLQIAAGQRSAAIETYMLCRTRLVEDLGIDPSNETTRLYEHVLGMED